MEGGEAEDSTWQWLWGCDRNMLMPGGEGLGDADWLEGLEG